MLSEKFKSRLVLRRLLEQQSSEALKQIQDAYDDIKRNIELAPPGAGRAAAVHAQIEKHRTPEVKLADKVSCRAGCGHCCHWKISVNAEEADLLMACVDYKKIEIDQIRLKIQKDFSERDFWAADEPVSRCVFLGDHNLCRVYEVRPSVCRNHKVSSLPENCRIDPDVPSSHKVIADLYPELIATAYDEVVGNKGFLADMILERISGRHRSDGEREEGQEADKDSGEKVQS